MKPVVGEQPRKSRGKEGMMVKQAVFDPANNIFGDFSHLDNDGWYVVKWENGEIGRLTEEEYLYGDIEHPLLSWPADCAGFAQIITYQGNDAAKGHSIFFNSNGYDICPIWTSDLSKREVK